MAFAGICEAGGDLKVICRERLSLVTTCYQTQAGDSCGFMLRSPKINFPIRLCLALRQMK